MAKDFSFDISAESDMQVMDDVINTAQREVDNRFDLKNTGATIELKREDKKVVFLAPADFQLEQIKDILSQKMARRGVSSRCLTLEKKEDASGGKVKETHTVVSGVDKEKAKEIVADIKKTGLKVQAAIQDGKIRVSSASKDALQSVMQFVKQQDYPLPLSFTNLR